MRGDRERLRTRTGRETLRRRVGRGIWTGDAERCYRARQGRDRERTTFVRFGVLAAFFQQANPRGTMTIYADQNHPNPDGQVPELQKSQLKHDESFTKFCGLSYPSLIFKLRKGFPQTL